ncbi:MAG: IS110 family transposase [Planctomycetes bacterium]|nr:IS110 family transposase [Planctomycetota bacterium]
MSNYSKYLGMDVHKDTISVAIAQEGQQEPRFYGQIPNSPQAIHKLIKKVCPGGEVMLFCYEAGPCGYEVYRLLTAVGQDCLVVAPSLIPKKAGVRVKTDRRDALSLARLLRAGELTAVWVPDQEQEAIRDLTRAREDFKATERRARQRLNAFLLRHGLTYTSGKSKWTLAHRRWLESLKLESPIQQIVFQEYLDAIDQASRRVADLESQMRASLPTWSWASVVEGLMALRGLSLVAAMTVVAELGDITRFDSPKELMAYIGLVPSEHSSGAARRQGAITKTGNGHVRRMLVESSWSYRFPARKTAYLQRRAAATSDSIQAIAWKAQKRLCGRYRKMTQVQSKLPVIACTAIARELLGFIWAIAKEVKRSDAPRVYPTP